MDVDAPEERALAARERIEHARLDLSGHGGRADDGRRWGLPYFRTYVPSLWQANAPIDVSLSKSSGTTQYAVLDPIAFPSDPASVELEDNHVVFKLRSDSQTTLRNVEHSLFEDSTSRQYVGDLFQLTSKRIGFLGRGFDNPSVSKQLAIQNDVAGAELIPDKSQLMLGFTSTQTAALGPDNIISFETLPGVANQWPSGYFAAGCAMHMSHLTADLVRWNDPDQGGFDYSTRVARMFSPRTSVPSDTSTVTLRMGRPRSRRNSSCSRTRRPPASSATTRRFSRRPGSLPTWSTTTGGSERKARQFRSARTSARSTTRSRGRRAVRLPPQASISSFSPRPVASSTQRAKQWTASFLTGPTCAGASATARTASTA